MTAVVVFALAGCGGDGDPAAAPTPTLQKSSSKPVTTPTATPTPTLTTAKPTPTSRPAADRAKTAVLVDGDLPDRGWDQDRDADPEGSGDQRSDRPACVHQSRALLTPKPVADQARGWVTTVPKGSEYLTSRVLVYRSPAEAAVALSAYRKAVAACTRWKSGGVDEYAFAEKQVTSGGASSVVRRSTTSAIGFPEVPPGTTVTVAKVSGDAIAVVTGTWGTGDRGVNSQADLERLATVSVGRAK